MGKRIPSLIIFATVGCHQASNPTANVPTFARDIAPIVFDQCAGCHRPGESAPFSLTTYAEVRDRANQIVQVTSSGYMPPWLPAEGPHAFDGERRLSLEQIQLLSVWESSGAPLGNPADLPPLPKWTVGWQLGQPDLVVEMPTPYDLSADGRDVYRNFVIPIPIETARYVRAMEFRPDNPKLVHHAFLMVNRDGECRRIDELDLEPGFDGMEATGSESPDGHFVSWQPGKIPSFAAAGTAWLLTPGTDLVLQLHMQPSGKPAQVNAKVGFFFTDEPPTRFPFKVVLRRTDIDIPPGATNHSIEDSFTLPVEVELLAVIPHAHYLGKNLEAIAVYPNGTEESLLRIPDWDFNWQGDYRYRPSVKLPSGTRLVQRFSYDNSEANPRNPNVPPQRVKYGLQSIDEMGELWLQLLPNSAADRQQLSQAFARKMFEDVRNQGLTDLRKNPTDTKLLIDVGKATLALESPQAASKYFRLAIDSDPNSAAAHYYLGHAALRAEMSQVARRELMEALRLDKKHFMAKHDLGLLAMQSDRLVIAEKYFRAALSDDAYHGTTLSNLALVLLKQNKLDQGIAAIERAIKVRPIDVRLQQLLKHAKDVRSNR